MENNIDKMINSGCQDDNIYAYENKGAKFRFPYVFVEIKTEDFHACIRKCFGNQVWIRLKRNIKKSLVLLFTAIR